MYSPCILSLVVLSLLTGRSLAQNLEAITLDVKFPSGRYDPVTVYDGQDTIYTYGGIDVYWKREILKYSLSEQTLQFIGTMKKDVGDWGSGVWLGQEEILHFGGRNTNMGGRPSTEIYSFITDNVDSNWTLVSHLPTACFNCPGVWDKAENTYIIGGSRSFETTMNTIFKYSSVTHQTQVVAQLPSPRGSTSAILDDNTGNIYIFGGSTTGLRYLNDILKFDPKDGSVTKLSAVLPVEVSKSCAVWTGKEAYIIGGYTNRTVDRPHIVRFNPTTNHVMSLTVSNFPDKVYGTGCVFVEKLNRIYILGGSAGSGTPRDQFMYIDLGPIPTTTEATITPEPTTTPEATTIPRSTPEPTNEQPQSTEPIISSQKPETSTDNPNDFECPTEEGLYPDPKNCRGFYNCAAWFPYHFCCPLPLFYNPLKDRCDFQDMVECPNDPTLPCDSPPGLKSSSLTRRN